MGEADENEGRGEKRERAFRAAEAEQARPRRESEKERDQVEADGIAFREEAEAEEDTRDGALEGDVLLECPEAEDDAGKPERHERRLDGRGPRRRHERGKQRREGAREMAGGLAPTAPDHALEHERADESEDRGGQPDRPFLRPENAHHHGEDPRKEDRRALRGAERRRREAEKLARPARDEVLRADRPAPLVRAEKVRLPEQHEPQEGAGRRARPRRGSARTLRDRLKKARTSRPGSIRRRRPGGLGFILRRR